MEGNRKQRSTMSCVDVQFDVDGVILRDHNEPDAKTIRLSTTQWTVFLANVITDSYTQSSEVIEVTLFLNGAAVLRSPTTGVELNYTSEQWGAFVAGARANGFQWNVSTSEDSEKSAHSTLH